MTRTLRAAARPTARHLYSTALLRLIALVALVGSAPAASAAESASVRLTAPAGTVAASDPVTLHVTIANDGADVLRVLAWNTPEDGLTSPLFSVTRNGQPVRYLGIVMKRPSPAEDDYLAIAPGGTLEYDVDLSRWYSFAESGDYEVSYLTASPQLFASASGGRIAGVLTSDPVRLYVEGRAEPLRKAVTADLVIGSSSFSNCSGPQQTSILTARDSASTYAGDCVDYFTANRSGQRYQKWFGSYLFSRWSSVDGHFSNIQWLVDTQSMTFDCACTDAGTYAYVFPSDASHTVYLCGAFWSAPNTGTDSRAGTLIHETSHFVDVADTDDYAYGQSAAQSLAVSSPSQAVLNADSHEYFAENTPSTADNAPAYTLDSYAHDFGSQDLAMTSGAFAFVLTNSGTTTLTLGTLAAAGDFALATNTCNGANLAPSATCGFSATFTPTAPGARAGSVTIPSNANVASSPALTGTGTTTGAACGDGNLDVGEECDDGNVYPDDGCSDTCTIEPCPAAPRTGCLEVAGASLLLSEKTPGKEKTKLQWKKIESLTTTGDFGDPVIGSTSLALCLYDDADGLVHSFVVDRGSDTCDGADCWAYKGSGFSYRDPLASSAGIAKASFSPGLEFKGKAAAAGANNPKKGLATLPAGIVAALSGNTQPTMQYATSDGLCLTATMNVVSRDDGLSFIAKKK